MRKSIIHGVSYTQLLKELNEKLLYFGLKAKQRKSYIINNESYKMITIGRDINTRHNLDHLSNLSMDNLEKYLKGYKLID